VGLSMRTGERKRIFEKRRSAASCRVFTKSMWREKKKQNHTRVVEGERKPPCLRGRKSESNHYLHAAGKEV